jgi:hypothetical protein
MNTPRTDAFKKTLKSWCGDESECLDFARQLERELSTEKDKVKELREALQFIADGNCDRAIQARNTARAILEKTK